MYDIIVCGSATVDVHAQSHTELIKFDTPHHEESLIALPSGSKVLIDELIETVGGGGTNTAVAFSRLGLKTGYVGCIGQDSPGISVFRLLKKEKITFLGHKCKVKTGYSIIIDSHSCDRAILTYKGANNELSYPKIKKSKAKWYYFSSMMGKSFASQKKLALHAKKQGARIAFNPSEYQVKEGFTKLKPLLKSIDLLIFNRLEAQLLCATTDLDLILCTLHELGISTIIITDGSNRIICSHEGIVKKIKPPSVKVVESTGAGDAFASGFLAWYCNTQNIDKSLRAGMHNATSVLQNHGAKNKLLTKKEMSTLL